MRVHICCVVISETKARTKKTDYGGRKGPLLINDQCYQDYRKLEELHATNFGAKTTMQPQRFIYPAIVLLCLPVIETFSSPESCIPPRGAVSLNTTSAK